MSEPLERLLRGLALRSHVVRIGRADRFPGWQRWTKEPSSWCVWIDWSTPGLIGPKAVCFGEDLPAVLLDALEQAVGGRP